MAQRSPRRAGAPRTTQRDRHPMRAGDDEGIIPVLAAPCARSRPPRSAARCDPPAARTFQVVALLVREERARVKADTELTEAAARRAAQAARRHRDDPGQDRRPRHLAASRCSPRTPIVSDRARRPASARCCARPASSREPEEPEPDRAEPRPGVGERRVVPQSVVAAPAGQPVPRPRLQSAAPRRARGRPAGRAGSCSARCSARSSTAGAGVRRAWSCPSPTLAATRPGGLELMPHQAQVVAAAAAGHRTFLLADEPGLGKTAQALLAAAGRRRLPAAGRRAQRRQDQLGPRGRAVDPAPHAPPSSTATATTIDGFADIVIVNYEVLDRHVGWLGELRLPRHGRRRGALHQEQDLAALAARARALRAASAPAPRDRC